MDTTVKISLTDIPRDIANENDDDIFGIKKYEDGLIEFIEQANTPITIALQGEWGSGKTSLMNTLKKRLCDDKNTRYFGVWINAWENALMKDPATAMFDIVNGLVKKITGGDGKSYREIGEKLLRACLIGVSAYITRSRDLATELLGNKPSISEIRNDLKKEIKDCLKKTNKQGLIFFIDDLDRIDPPIAVQLLELLKNMFIFEHCVFILAIDYDVVIKGLEPKFGKLSEKNEREFRSFFDKIIQVPFSMPITRYQINEFLKESLLSVQYLNENQSNNKDLITAFSEISNLSVGTNPRALKRLLNSLLLIQCINNQNDDGKVDSELELLVNFALVSIQIAFPFIYRVLSTNPGFDNWNKEILIQQNIQIDENELVTDNSWEKILFRLCENDDYLKRQVPNISKMLNHLKRLIEEKGQIVEDVVGDIISLSSVTIIEPTKNQPTTLKTGKITKFDCLRQLYDELEFDKPYSFKDIYQGFEAMLTKNGLTSTKASMNSTIIHSIVNHTSRHHYIVRSPYDKGFFYYPNETKKDYIQKFSLDIKDNPTIYWGDSKGRNEIKLSELLNQNK